MTDEWQSLTHRFAISGHKGCVTVAGTAAALPCSVVLNHVPSRGRTIDLAEAAVRDYGAAVAPVSPHAYQGDPVHCLRQAVESIPDSPAWL